MKKLIIAILIACLAVPALASPAYADKATVDEALTVAENWIALIIQNKGNWGGSETAEVEDIQEFKRGERAIGYFCRVKPQGFIVVSLYKGLAPVKTYSATGDLDPVSDEGLADLIKGKMEQILDWVEELVGPIESASAEDMDAALEINYRDAWAVLQRDVQSFKDRLQSGDLTTNYQEGEVLLTSSWDQGDPYNQQCPAPPAGDDCTAPRCLVGCVPLAGAQVMRYWNWPPYRGSATDPYDWPNMPDRLTASSPQVQIDAVAELCHEIGIECGADYCDGSGCQTGACFASCAGKDLLDTFEDHFRYNTAADDYYRDDYPTGEAWFNELKGQLNLNRPLPYRVKNHVIVCDGWRERWVGEDLVREYHMNYGWDDANNAWWVLDELYLGGKDEEIALVRIYPAQALKDSLSGTYSRGSFPYRYFDQDATGDSATFEAGQYLQFLPGIAVTCASTTGGSVRFEGTTSDNTHLFTRGDTSEGIRIYDGAIALYENGSITFPPIKPPKVRTVGFSQDDYYVWFSGELDDLGYASSVRVSFEWGRSPSGPWDETPPEEMSTAGMFYISLSQTDLDPGTTYFFRAKAVGQGTDYGDVMEFTTPWP